MPVCLEMGEFRIRKCESCSIVFLDHHPDPDMLRAFYSEEYFRAGGDDRGYESYADCEPFLTKTFRNRVARLHRHVPGGNVLDIGCGYGFFLKCLDDRFKGIGLDISEHAVRVAREESGVEAGVGPLTRSAFPVDHFSLVTMWDVIEHLPDPRDTLDIVHGVLKDDGVLALTTGNVESVAARVSGKRWHLFTLPDHLWFFSRRTLTDLLEKVGFRVVEIRNEWSYYSVDYLIERAAKTLVRSRSLTRRMPLKSVLRRATIPFTLFDVLYVVCRKR